MRGVRCVDLHTHSLASDGTRSPREIVRLALDRGLAALALTDHDTLGGLDEAADAARLAREAGADFDFVAGVELSCALTLPRADGTPLSGEIHILGLHVQPGRWPGADAFFRHLADGRRERMEAMLTRAEALGLPVILSADGHADESVRHHSLDAAMPGRPHLARALVTRGVVKTIHEAFARYLRDGGPLDVPKPLVSMEAAVGAIHRMGGLALLAHPGLSTRWGTGALERWLREAWPENAARGPAGLDGVEVYHPKHSSEMTARWLRFARDRDAAVSGGSDFHDASSFPAEVGRPPVPFEIHTELMDRVAVSRLTEASPFPPGAECV